MNEKGAGAVPTTPAPISPEQKPDTTMNAHSAPNTAGEQRDELIHDMLSSLASLDTHDVNLRDNPQAYAIVEAMLAAIERDPVEVPTMTVDEFASLAQQCGAEVSHHAGEVAWIKFHHPAVAPFAARITGEKVTQVKEAAPAASDQALMALVWQCGGCVDADGCVSFNPGAFWTFIAAAFERAPS